MFFMSRHPKRTPGVETVLLMSSFAVVRLAQCVAVSPLYISLSPPTVRRTRWVLTLFGRMVHSFFPYVTFLLLGTALRRMNLMVLVPTSVPCLRPGMPWASRHRSLPYASYQVSLSCPLMRAGYSSSAPVCWLRTARANAFVAVWCLERRLYRGVMTGSGMYGNSFSCSSSSGGITCEDAFDVGML